MLRGDLHVVGFFSANCFNFYLLGFGSSLATKQLNQSVLFDLWSLL